MRLFEIALLIIAIQVGMGIVTESGAFGSIYYENKLTNINIPENASALSETEQIQASINIWGKIIDALTWGWIKNYFQPLYTTDTNVKTFVDHLIMFLNGISAIIIGAGFIEFARNRIKVI